MGSTYIRGVKLFRALSTFASSISLIACGGGGGGNSSGDAQPVVSKLSFPLNAATKSDMLTANSYTLVAIGTSASEKTDGLCSGTLTHSRTPYSTQTTFEGATAWAAVDVDTLQFSNCTPSTTTSTSTSYVDSNYTPLGSSGSSYSLFLSPPSIPNSVRVGDSGTIGTIFQYTDSTKSVANGRREITYSVEPETETSAIINYTTKRYNQSSQLLYTEIDRSSIKADGTLTVLSADIQYSTTSTTHLVFRRATNASNNPIVRNVAFWSFDNMTGASAPNTTYPGLDAVLNSASIVPGKFGNAIQFDPNLNSYAVISGAALLPQGGNISIAFPDNKISVAMWINPTTINSNSSSALFGGGVGGTQSFHLRLVNGKIVFLLNAPNGGSNQEDTIITSNSGPAAGTWTHVAVTYDGNSATLYLNGVVDATRNISHSINGVFNNLYVGASYNISSSATMIFPGAIDELELSQSVLTSSQIAQLVAGVRP